MYKKVFGANNNHRHIANNTMKEGVIMTPKELLYIEDALSHGEYIRTQCNDCATKLQDPSLKNFATQLCQQNKDLFNKFYNTVAK